MFAGIGAEKAGNRGFTLAEVIVTSVILMLVIGVAVSTYVILVQYVKDMAGQAFVQAKARTVIDRMTRDIREAANITCSGSGDTLTLTYDVETLGPSPLYATDWTSRYRLSGSRILFTQKTSVGTEVAIIDNVSLDTGDKLFYEDPSAPNFIEITLKISKAGASSTQYADIITTVKARNAD